MLNTDLKLEETSIKPSKEAGLTLYLLISSWIFLSPISSLSNETKMMLEKNSLGSKGA